MLDKIEAFVFDMDGVFYKGEQKLDGGKELIDFLKEQNIPFIFLTNNSRKIPKDYVKKLSDLGIVVKENKIITAGVLAKEYINQYYKNKKINIFGSKALFELFDKRFICEDDFDVVLIGMEENLTLDDISKIRSYAAQGKQLVFTNPDKLIPIENGYNFECGAIISLIQSYCKKEPIIVGKPSTFSFEYAIKSLDVEKNKIAMVGDTYDTDIQGAIDIGIVPIHLQTSSADYNSTKLKAFEFNNLKEIFEKLKESKNEVYTLK